MYDTILTPLVLAVLAYILGRLRDNNKQVFDKKLEIYSNIVCEINTHSYLRSSDNRKIKDDLVKLFAPARLVGGNDVVKEVREYFSLVDEYLNATDIKVKDSLMDKISESAMELEQLLRKDLGKNRDLTKTELLLHNWSNRN